MWGARALFAGFPCTDVSGLNRSRRAAANMACVAGASLRTGSVFQGILDFLQSPQGAEVDLVLLENVRSLDDRHETDGGVTSNLIAAVQKLNDADVTVVTFELDPRLLGTPQMRSRLWMVAMPRRVLRRLGATEAAARRYLTDCMARLVGSQLVPLDEYLLAESDPLAQANYQPARPTEAKGKAKAKSSECPDWVSRHVGTAAKRGHRWWVSTRPSSKERTTLFPGLLQFSARELDLMDMLGVKEFPEKVTRTLETSQRIERTHVYEGHIACVLPKGKPCVKPLVQGIARPRADQGARVVAARRVWRSHGR